MQRMIDAMERFGGLVLVANSEPFESSYGGFDHEHGEYTIDENRRGGGVVSALNSPMQMLNGRAIWVALATGEADAHTVNPKNYILVPPGHDSRYMLLRVFAKEEDQKGYYDGYSNRELWPIFHNVGVNPAFGDEYEGYWEAYTRVNSIFASNSIKAFNDIKSPDSEDPLIMVNDYHLMLVPQRIREMDIKNGQCTSSAVISYFHHVPWSSWEMFSRLPHRKELVDGITGSDIIGFHTYDYVENFLRCAGNLNGDEGIKITDGEVNGKDAARMLLNGKEIYVTKFPIGIDVDRHARFAEEGGNGWEAANKYIEGGFPEDGILLLSVSRFDYTKGVEEEINALKRFLQENPDYTKRVRLLHVLSSTRSDIPEYKQYVERVERLAKDVNNEFRSSKGITPLTLYTEGMTHEQLASLYRFADVFIVSSKRDGMNLTPFEYGASQLTGNGDRTGAIILSEFTGAKEVMGEHCITINPYYTVEFSRAIKEAIEMPHERKKEIMRGIQESVWGNTASDWMADMFEFAGEIKERKNKKIFIRKRQL